MANSPPLNPVTALRGYPLPVGGNSLADDVNRLAQAITMVDADTSAAAVKLVSIRVATTTYLVLASDVGVLVDYRGSNSNDVITLPALNTVPVGYSVWVRNSTTATSIFVDGADSAAISGQALYPLLPATSILVMCDGSTWKVLASAQVAGGALSSSGTLSLPGIGFSADPSVGLYRVSAGQAAIVASGVSLLTWSSNGLIVGSATGGFKGAGTLNANKVYYNGQDLILRNDGTALAPTYSFGSETSLGLYRAGAGQLGIAAGGAKQFVVSVNGLAGVGVTAVNGAQLAGSANLTDLYLNGVSLSQSLTFSPSGLLMPNATGGFQGAGTVNAADLFINGNSLSALLGLSGSNPTASVHATDLVLAGNSLASTLSFGSGGLVVVGAVGGAKGAGTLNVAGLYINGAALNPGLIAPTAQNALGYLRVNADGNGIDYRTASQLLNDLGVQTALGYIPVNRNGDTMTSLTIVGTLDVGAAVDLSSTLSVAGTTSLQNLSVIAATSIGGSLTVAGVTTLAQSSASSLTVSGSLGVSGASTLAAVTATTLRVGGGVTITGTTTLAGLSATTGTFTGVVNLSQGLAVAGTSSLSRLSVGSTSSFTGAASFAGGMSLQNGNFAVGIGQQFTTQDPVGGFQVMAGVLPNTAGSTMALLQIGSSVGSNQQALKLVQRRTTSGSDWTSAALRLQLLNDTTAQAYLEWFQAPSGLGGLRLGALNTNGIDTPLLTLDGASGVTFSASVSINAFLGVGGGAQINGGVSLTGGVTVDTLTGTGNWATAGNVSCRFVTQTSDRRMKRDIGGVAVNAGLEFVRSVTPVSYRWRDQGQDSPRHFGYIAQDIQDQGFHELVRVRPDGDLPDQLSLDPAGITPLLHQALRYALARIDLLQRLVADLQQRGPRQ